MSLTSYTGLQTAVANWLQRADSSSFVADWIVLCETRLNRELRVNRMLTRSTSSIASEFGAVPTDFQAPRSMRLTTSPYQMLQYLTPEQMQDYRTWHHSDGCPLKVYSRVGAEFWFWPAPATATAVELLYYAAIPALSDSNTSNWVLSNYPDAYLHGTMLEAALYYEDTDLVSAHGTLFQQALDAIRQADQKDNFAANINPTPSGAVV